MACTDEDLCSASHCVPAHIKEILHVADVAYSVSNTWRRCAVDKVWPVPRGSFGAPCGVGYCVRTL